MAAGGLSMTILKRDLTDRRIRSLKAAPGKRPIEWDAQVSGFGVRVTDKGHRTFVLVTRYPDDPSRPVIRAIGNYPTMTLARAREVAREWRNDIAEGVDPKDKAEAAKRAAEAARREAERRQANTFGLAFEAFRQEHLAKLRTGAVVAGVIEKHVMPVFCDTPLAEITPDDADDLLRSIAKKTPTHARRIKAYLHKFGVWAKQDRRIKESPFLNLTRFGEEQGATAS